MSGYDVIQETGVRHTAEFCAEIDCKHPQHELRWVLHRNGARALVSQCLICWATFGLARPASSAPRDTKNAEPESKHEDWIRPICLKHVEIQALGWSRHKEAYQAYLQSDEWKWKRSAVMARSRGICEGCGKKPPQDVHHLTYEHIFEEFLWELVAVCTSCHERAHEQDRD